jgi:hypothetical protein
MLLFLLSLVGVLYSAFLSVFYLVQNSPPAPPPGPYYEAYEHKPAYLPSARAGCAHTYQRIRYLQYSASSSYDPSASYNPSASFAPSASYAPSSAPSFASATSSGSGSAYPRPTPASASASSLPSIAVASLRATLSASGSALASSGRVSPALPAASASSTASPSAKVSPLDASGTSTLALTLQFSSVGSASALLAYLTANASAVQNRFAAYGIFRPPESVVVRLTPGGTPPAVTLLFEVKNATLCVPADLVNATDLMRALLSPDPYAASVYATGGGTVASLALNSPKAPGLEPFERSWAMELTIPAGLFVAILGLMYCRYKQCADEARANANDKLVKSRPPIAILFEEKQRKKELKKEREAAAAAGEGKQEEGASIADLPSDEEEKVAGGENDERFVPAILLSTANPAFKRKMQKVPESDALVKYRAMVREAEQRLEDMKGHIAFFEQMDVPSASLPLTALLGQGGGDATLPAGDTDLRGATGRGSTAPPPPLPPPTPAAAAAAALAVAKTLAAELWQEGAGELPPGWTFDYFEGTPFFTTPLGTPVWEDPRADYLLYEREFIEAQQRGVDLVEYVRLLHSFSGGVGAPGPPPASFSPSRGGPAEHAKQDPGGGGQGLAPSWTWRED